MNIAIATAAAFIKHCARVGKLNFDETLLHYIQITWFRVYPKPFPENSSHTLNVVIINILIFINKFLQFID